MSILIAMSLFALSMSISPGPVNILTLSTGMNHGFKCALPFVSGATIGFTLLLLLTGLSTNLISGYNQGFLDILGYVGCAFIGYLGYRILTAQPNLSINNQQLPTFLQGCLLQWLNPKAWVACLAGISAFGLTKSYILLGLFVTIYFLVCYLSIASWAYAGAKISRWVVKPSRIQIVNKAMGATLILLALYLLYNQVASA